jgi:hypothetical protein
MTDQDLKPGAGITQHQAIARGCWGEGEHHSAIPQLYPWVYLGLLPGSYTRGCVIVALGMALPTFRGRWWAKPTGWLGPVTGWATHLYVAHSVEWALPITQAHSEQVVTPWGQISRTDVCAHTGQPMWTTHIHVVSMHPNS